MILNPSPSTQYGQRTGSMYFSYTKQFRRECEKGPVGTSFFLANYWEIFTFSGLQIEQHRLRWISRFHHGQRNSSDLW